MSAPSHSLDRQEPTRHVSKRRSRPSVLSLIEIADKKVEDLLAKFAGVFQIGTPKFLYRTSYLQAVLVFMLLFYFGLDAFTMVIFEDRHTMTAEISAFRQATLLSIFALSIPYMLFTRQNFQHILKLQLPLMALMAFCALSLIWTVSPDATKTRVILFYVQVLPILALFAARPSKKFFFDSMCIASGIVLVFNALSFFVQFSFDPNTDSGYRAYFSSKNLLGMFAMLCLGIWICALLYYENRRLKIVSAAMLALSAYFLIISDSKTSFAVAIVSIVPALFLAFAVKSGQRAMFFTMLISFVFMTGFGFFLVWYGFDPITEGIYGDTTLTGRTEIWGHLFRFINEDPWLGVGYRGFWDAGADSPHLQLPEYLSFNQGHNGYIDALLTIGGLGLIFLAIYILQPFFALMRIAKGQGGPSHSTPLLAAFLFFPICAILHNITESSYMMLDMSAFAAVVFATMVISAVNRKFDRVSFADDTTKAKRASLRKAERKRKARMAERERMRAASA